MQFNARLDFDGRAAEAMRFHGELLGGELEITTFAQIEAAS